MAKKRGQLSAVENMVGAESTIQNAALSHAQSLASQLKDTAKSGQVDIESVLLNWFGYEVTQEERHWTLQSGKKVKFKELNLSYDEVLKNTAVTFGINGRDQSLLTEESLQDLEFFDKQQFFPAVGRYVNGLIDILDGSRRRAKYLLDENYDKKFRVLVTEDEIDVADAKRLAKALQSAKEHSLREVGLLALEMQQDDETLTQRDLANLLGYSLSKINRALIAAKIDSNLISLFPNVNDLVISNYSQLSKIQSAVGEDLPTMIELTKEEIEKFPKMPSDELKDAIIKYLQSLVKKFNASKSSKAKTSVVDLVKFDEKAKFARKTTKDRKVSYMFSRLSASSLEKLDKAILDVLKDLD